MLPCVLTGQVYTTGDTTAELRTYKYKDITSDGCSARITLYYRFANNNAILSLYNIVQLHPSHTNTTNLGSPSLQWNNTYTRNILIDNDINIASSIINKTSSSGVISIRGGTNYSDGASIGLYGKDYNGGIAGAVTINAYGNSDYTNLYIYPNGTMSVYNNSTNTTKNIAMQEDVNTLLSGKANSSHTHTKSEITDFPTIPTKTSDLTNDSGFLTSHQDLSGYIPLSGTNALSGSIVPDTDNAYNLGSSSYTYKTIYTHRLDLAMSNAITRNVNNEELNLYGGVDYFGGAVFQLKGKDVDSYKGCFVIRAYDGSVETSLIGDPRGYLTWGSKNVAMQEDTVPRSGGAVLSGVELARTVNNSEIRLCGGTTWNNGSAIALYGKDNTTFDGRLALYASNNSNSKPMILYPDGTWTWEGQAVQLVSDQRFKQQITEIDNKLLDAWEDVEPCQFKYNDAVKEKLDNARLHTGYVVQQIDDACKSHGVDISEYGLYCHEEYPERTEEVEVQKEDGTKVKETRVIEPAKEHYSLRYTETLVVECAYLRRENDKLKQQIQQILETLDVHSKILNSIN